MFEPYFTLNKFVVASYQMDRYHHFFKPVWGTLSETRGRDALTQRDELAQIKFGNQMPVIS